NAKAKQIDSIFAKPIIVPASQKFSTAPTGRVYYRYKIEKLNSAMSVQGLTASLTLKLNVSTNGKAGDVAGYKEQVGYSDSTKAVLNSDFRSCESPGFWTDEWCRGDIRVIYEYKDNRWNLKEIKADIENRIGLGTIRGDIERGVLDVFLK
ncbi:MAG: hypothetical protein JWO03_1728, partial [Bacteroidetes bacterium]|nr:hypothetical protein [Bacteroidota bacterium]